MIIGLFLESPEGFVKRRNCMEKTAVDLYTLQTRLKSAVESSLPGKIWVSAEVSAVKARPGGHCYLELSESGPSGLMAKATAIIWSSKFRFLAPYFESVAGIPFREGINVLVLVQVNFSQMYGLSLIVEDIDPNYTLGDAEKKRRETVERLSSEGLLDRQRTLALPRLPYRLAVVSAPDAAGYRDFIHHLHENEYGFVYSTALVPAVMQGAAAPASIVQALETAGHAEVPYDAVLLIRGGGARLDLACFDEYEVAAAVARCPVPVLTAIGHDQDYHVCDMAAWKHVKTPTALADEFLDIYMDEDQRISSFGTRLKAAFLNKISAMGSRLDVLEARIAGADPRKILSRGYALVLDSAGVVMKESCGKCAGDGISVMFADGTLECEVKKRINHGKD